MLRSLLQRPDSSLDEYVSYFHPSLENNLLEATAENTSALYQLLVTRGPVFACSLISAIYSDLPENFHLSPFFQALYAFPEKDMAAITALFDLLLENEHYKPAIVETGHPLQRISFTTMPNWNDFFGLFDILHKHLGFNQAFVSTRESITDESIKFSFWNSVVLRYCRDLKTTKLHTFCSKNEQIIDFCLSDAALSDMIEGICAHRSLSEQMLAYLIDEEYIDIAEMLLPLEANPKPPSFPVIIFLLYHAADHLFEKAKSVCYPRHIPAISDKMQAIAFEDTCFLALNPEQLLSRCLWFIEAGKPGKISIDCIRKMLRQTLLQCLSDLNPSSLEKWWTFTQKVFVRDTAYEALLSSPMYAVLSLDPKKCTPEQIRWFQAHTLKLLPPQSGRNNILHSLWSYPPLLDTHGFYVNEWADQLPEIKQLQAQVGHLEFTAKALQNGEAKRSVHEGKSCHPEYAEANIFHLLVQQDPMEDSKFYMEQNYIQYRLLRAPLTQLIKDYYSEQTEFQRLVSTLDLLVNNAFSIQLDSEHTNPVFEYLTNNYFLAEALPAASNAGVFNNQQLVLLLLAYASLNTACFYQARSLKSSEKSSNDELMFLNSIENICRKMAAVYSKLTSHHFPIEQTTALLTCQKDMTEVKNAVKSLRLPKEKAAHVTENKKDPLHLEFEKELSQKLIQLGMSVTAPMQQVILDSDKSHSKDRTLDASERAVLTFARRFYQEKLDPNFKRTHEDNDDRPQAKRSKDLSKYRG